MKQINKGSIVTRKSYNCDMLFYIDKIIKGSSGTSIAILKGLTNRIIADAYLNDLFIVSKKNINHYINNNIISELSSFLFNKKNIFRLRSSENLGKILHLDGDKRYSEKSIRYYKRRGLRAVVKNISESKQPYIVQNLIIKYQPQILVITGHDSMLKSNRNFSDINNYRNSKYFIQTVIEARKLIPSFEKLSIFAGACQSYFEAIISSGANFASSPARIFIDFMDPLVVAEKIATTPQNVFISTKDLLPVLRDGKKGIDGIGSKGKMKL